MLQLLTQQQHTFNAHTQSTSQAIQQMQQQLSQLTAERDKGKFPTQPIANPKGNGNVYEVGSFSS